MTPKFGKSVHNYLEEKKREKQQEEFKIKRMKYVVSIMALMLLNGISFMSLNIPKEETGWYVAQFLSAYCLGYFILKLENLE